MIDGKWMAVTKWSIFLICPVPKLLSYWAHESTALQVDNCGGFGLPQ